MKFTDFGLNDALLDALYYMNFEDATEIQDKAIPLILEGRDVIGCAQTGTGKTAAFVLPILNHISESAVGGVQTLILCPTRELAIQIDHQIQGLAYFAQATCHAVYGGGDGVAWDQEALALKGGADIIIATPGRLLSHMEQGNVDFSEVKHLILDEADRMLDIGFYDDIIRIIKTLPAQRQSLMFSATMAPKIRNLAKEILSDPAEISVAISKPAEGVTQQIYLAHEEQKIGLTQHLLKDKDGFTSIIIFCSTKRKVEQLTRKLAQRNYSVPGMSSDYEQDAREKALSAFKAGRTRIMVATDVMSRGIDIKGIDLVINYDVPNDAEDYVHRIGRTARAKTEGMAITFVCPEDMYKLTKIERLIERDFEKLSPPEHLGEAPVWNANGRGVGRGGRFGGPGRSGGGASGGRSGGKSGGFRGGKSRNQGPRPGGTTSGGQA